MRKKTFATAAVLLLASIGTAYAATSADGQAINTSCSGDASNVGCGGKTVGNGLVKCMVDYKKAHPDYAFSDACKTAMGKGMADYKAAKEASAPAQ